MEIQHWIRPHEHPLRLREDAGNDRFSCQICNSCIQNAVPFYACDSCNSFYAHKSCAQLPHQIQHPFHPHSPLTLSPNMSARCDSCHRDLKDAQIYCCGSCEDFDMDVECALMPLAVPSDSIEGRDWIRHFGHPHPLLLSVDPKIKCSGCKFTNGGGDHQALYGCSKCHYFLHKSCVQLPQKIYLPVHRLHHNEFDLRIRRFLLCDECDTMVEDQYNFSFECKKCTTRVCFKCTRVVSSPKIEYEDHQHPLRLMRNVDDTSYFLSQCNGYESYCAQRIVMSCDEFKKIDSLLWCLYCAFKVHLLCAPLPSVINHEFHTHSLVLVDSLAEDDSGEYYCDVCETKRDPRIRLYCCQDCKYFAHLHCVIPEVLQVLLEEGNEVELKRVGDDIWNVSGCELTVDPVVSANITLKDVINQLPEHEKQTLQSFYKWDETSSQDQKAEQEGDLEIIGDGEIDEILQLAPLNDESFRRFWSSVNEYFNGIENKVELKSSDLAMKIVNVKGYMIPHSLAPVLNKLLFECGDISSGSSKSIGFKSFVLFVICKVVKRMHITFPACITKNLLQEWCFHLVFPFQQYFEVAFALKQVQELAHAFLAFQAKRLEHEIPALLTKKIEELQLKRDKCKRIWESPSQCEYQEYCLKLHSDLEWKANAFGDGWSRKRSTDG